MSVVYFVQRVTGGPIKIGVTAYLDSRIAQLQSTVKASLKVLAYAPGSFRDEGRLHRQFADHRLEGEWFADCDEVRAAVAFVAKHDRLPPALEEDREVVMAARYLGGETLAKIAADFDVTRERVRQILRATNVPSLGFRQRHRARAKPLSDTEIEIVDAYKSGSASPRVLGERYGITRNQLNTVLRRAKVKAFPAGHWLKRDDDAERTAEIVRLYKAGVKTVEIATRIGLGGQEHVYRYLKKAGVSPKRRASGGLDVAGACAAYQNGGTLKEIAAAQGVNPMTVRRHVANAGLLRSRAEADAIRIARVMAANRRRAGEPTRKSQAVTQ